jgi:hypothetical protein
VRRRRLRSHSDPLVEVLEGPLEVSLLEPDFASTRVGFCRVWFEPNRICQVRQSVVEVPRGQIEPSPVDIRFSRLRMKPDLLAQSFEDDFRIDGIKINFRFLPVRRCSDAKQGDDKDERSRQSEPTILCHRLLLRERTANLQKRS